MKAIRVHAYGQPPQVDDVPEPEASGPDDVVVRIGGAGLCRTDLHIIDGWFADTIPALDPGSFAVAVGAGGLGHIGIQCLKAMTSAQVVAVDTREDALKLAVDCGADHVVTADGQQAQQVRDLTGAGADAVFDFVGEDSTISDSVAMLRPGGTYYLVGYGGTVTLPTLPLVLGEITIAANLIGTYPDLAGLVALADQGKVVLHSARYPLATASDAIDDLRHGRIRGRAILIPG